MEENNMDIRNIKEMPPVVPDILEGIFDIGKSQIAMYRNAGIEELPEFPINVNIPKSQELLKDFISRVVEELIEGYQSTNDAYAICNELGWNLCRALEEQEDHIQGSLQNACEEQADALGFFMTLLLYANVDAKDIYRWAEVTYKHLKIKNLGEVMAWGRYILNHETCTNFIIGEPTNITPGFYEMSEISHAQERDYLFQVIESLNLARNSLKCRPWKQTQIMTKEIEFQNYLVEAFYRYMGFLNIYKFTPSSLYVLYYKKYKLNEWRTQSGY